MNFLDYNGLSRFFSGLKNIFAEKEHSHKEVSTSTNGFMSASDKQKLDSVDIRKICIFDGTVSENPETVETAYDYLYKSSSGINVDGKHYAFPTFASLVCIDGQETTIDKKILSIEKAIGSSDGSIDGGEY